MIKYLHIDCEMGGRELKYSLLTAYFLVTDSDFRKQGDLYLYVKPDDGVYIVGGQGMSVNGINLQEHDAKALTYKQAKPLLYAFLKQHGEKNFLTPVGHGVRGDIIHILDKLISEGSWEQFCTYHYMDTSVILQFLRAKGVMPEGEDGSVGALARYFDIPCEGKLHDAKVDAELTAKVLQKMLSL